MNRFEMVAISYCDFNCPRCNQSYDSVDYTMNDVEETFNCHNCGREIIVQTIVEPKYKILNIVFQNKGG